MGSESEKDFSHTQGINKSAVFSSNTCVVSSFTFRFLVHLAFILVVGKRYGFNFLIDKVPLESCGRGWRWRCGE